ncbi:alpha-1,2-fucosyltransferase [Parablautia intestinalis]|uniref:alpha-1,2-fucosyltransferase n=1 Tax=Parablautia intestinalis TaxID=2320100 RepID=UPI00256EECB5|nr:alpha-1,2-fucosyltransferase [Parablautia intestinalis]
MIIVQVAGGLGNQLQQYALYRKFVRLGKEARLDVSWFSKESQGKVLAKRELELAYFDRLIYEVCTPGEKAKLIGTEGIAGKLKRKLLPGTVRWFHESKIYHPELLSFENMYISGYFACEKYYSDILYDLREKIQFPVSSNPLNIEMAQEMKHRQSVSVHIRRGDYLDPENMAVFGNICTELYYETAIRLVKGEVPEAHFYLFSDDISYVSSQYKGSEYTVVDINHGKDSFYDMWLMSNCKHNICANSTFSFWGARLNGNDDKIMVRPTIHKNSQFFVKEEMEDLWEGWRFVNPLGKIE